MLFAILPVSSLSNLTRSFCSTLIYPAPPKANLYANKKMAINDVPARPVRVQSIWYYVGSTHEGIHFRITHSWSDITQ